MSRWWLPCDREKKYRKRRYATDMKLGIVGLPNVGKEYIVQFTDKGRGGIG